MPEKIIEVGPGNIGNEHICCALSNDRKNSGGVAAKKCWLSARFGEGLKFRKLDEQGKVFIEYIPAEFAWKPVIAPGYLVIHCLWVSGKYKGRGYARKLLEECLEDAEGTDGIAVVTSSRPFATDKSIFLKFGFEICDTADPWFELLVKRLTDAPLPRFCDRAKTGICDDADGFVIYTSDQCPFLGHYPREMADVVSGKFPVRTIRLESAEQVRNSPSPYGTFGVFYNGKFLTHQPMSAGGFEKFLTAKGIL